VDEADSGSASMAATIEVGGTKAGPEQFLRCATMALSKAKTSWTAGRRCPADRGGVRTGPDSVSSNELRGDGGFLLV